MDSESYLTLNAWLQKSDGNYIAGRILWKSLLVEQAGNLLWLASEQMMKILLLQKNVGAYSAAATSLADLHTRLDTEAKRLGHNTGSLFSSLGSEYTSLSIFHFQAVLDKMNDLFYRRYVVHSGNSISFNALDQIDEFYFLLRNEVLPDVGVGTIDEIHIQRKHGWPHPLASFKFAYLDNTHFKPRTHLEYNIAGPDGILHKEVGD